MLHPAYSLKPTGIYAEYDKEVEYAAAMPFIENLPDGGRDHYLQALRSMYLDLYGAYAKASGKEYFLDKTPRYYFILEELMELYPQAKFIVIRRHPIDVLYSIIKSWTKQSWFQLSKYRFDLKTALIELDSVESKRVCVVSYEMLVEKTDNELGRICDYIGIPYETAMQSYETNEQWELGDQKTIYQQSEVRNDRLAMWATDSLDFQTWRVLWDYLSWVGPERMARAGYDFEAAQQSLTTNMPAATREEINEKSFSLDSLMDQTKDCLIENTRLVRDNEFLLEQSKSQQLALDEIKENYSILTMHLERLVNFDTVKQPFAKARSLKHLVAAFLNIRGR